MNKLTLKQLWDAVGAARKIEALGHAKAKAAGWTVPFVFTDGNYAGGLDRINVPVPTEIVVTELDARIAAAHAVLASMGIELVPGEGDGDD
jgi:hypothetical protein